MPGTHRIKRRDMLKGLPLAAALPAAALGAQEDKRVEYDSERMIEQHPEFKDARSRKVIFVAHCILNQNARIRKCAYTPSAIPKVPAELIERGIGIVQMACPELGALGLGRGGPVEIYDQLSTPIGRRYLRTLASDIVYQVRQYRKQGYRVLGVLGLDGSPSCGVDLTWYGDEHAGRGAYMEELIIALKEAGLDIPVLGIQDAAPDKALEIIRKWDSA
ncbi:hypothetical protein LLH00_05605 [bacterium]|nr:hypothetical protein [bacterium]